MDFLAAWLQVSLPILIPTVVFGLKGLFGKVPKVVYPIAAAGLGVASTFVTGDNLGGGALAGLAAVGVREVIDQSVKFLSSPPE